LGGLQQGLRLGSEDPQLKEALAYVIPPIFALEEAFGLQVKQKTVRRAFIYCSKVRNIR
jgi:hypothetical protein